MSQLKETQLKKRNAALEKELLAKNRELEIEAALERVRARTMAMQRSEELAEASFLLDSQVRALGIKTWGCAFNIYGDNESTEWFSSEAGTMPLYKTPRENVFLRYYGHGQKGESMYIQEFAGETCAAHYDYLCTLPVIGKALKKLKESGGSFPIRQIDHATYFKYGYLLFITLEPVPEAHDIFNRFAKVFEQTYTRFLDLQKAEAQAREAQIEAALERVRSRSMAMHKSNEIGDVAFVLFQQLKSLGGELWGTGFGFCKKDSDVDEYWFANENGIMPHLKIPHTIDPTHKQMYQGWKKNLDLFSIAKDGKELKDHYKYMLTVPDVQPIFQGMLDNGIKFPKWQKWHAAYFKYGYLLAITTESYENEDIFKRFAKVFEQAYTRFLDLQKAEAQAREAQIETALERVRSRSMAMHKSDELLEVINVVSEQLQHLGTKFSNASFGINTDSFDFDFWVAAPGIDHPFRIHLPYLDSPIFNRLKDAQINEQSFFADSFNAIETREWMQHLFANNDITEFTPQTKEYLLSKTGFVRSSVLLRNIILSIINYEGIRYSNDENDVFIRFANAFEQAYTRFLDLQKAEAQAREAQIEAALEKVRSRSLAMYKSDELKEVIKVVYNQFVHLNIHIEHTGFIIDYKTSEDMKIWLADRHEVPAQVTIPYFDTPHWNSFIEAKEQGKDFFANHFTFEEKNKFYQELFEFIPVLAEEIKEYYLGCAGLAISTILMDNIGLYIENFSGTPYTDEENNILMRFGKVFQQTYTRFNDLQKAEAQAREAQIEASLERVRSRTMAMQNSNELPETALVVFKQLITLGIAPNRLYIGIINEDNGAIEFWATDEDGTKISNKFTGNKNGNTSVRKMYDGWSAQQKSLTIDLQGKELSDYLDYLGNELHVPFKEGASQKRRVQTMSFFSKGFIGIASPDEQPEETTKLLGRFAAVFNITYTRFNDLKIAEAHSIKAAKDLILLQTEKKKAEEALTELKATQSQLIQSEKMASLGELTAGIAHEIQNPLNFVNNFSEVSKELIEEMLEELKNGNNDEVNELANDIIQNLDKINHHGKRADGIVKSMLQHSRTSSGVNEPTNINVLTDEYLRLAYHGLRAKDKSFNATMETDYDASIGKINVIPQDIGRVILNLITNAFYAINDKKKQLKNGSSENSYQPTVWVSTKKEKNNVLISVKDNGNGIPQKVIDKIFQPFFTTKPTGEGTGLGLSMSYDIVKAHGGEIKVSSKENNGTEFSIILPV